MPAPELFHFRFSTYSEKIRWVLDYKGMEYVDREILPGTHIPKMLALSGQKSVPVLRSGDGKVLSGSANILAWCEEEIPEPRLLPADAAARARVLEIQARFDDHYGPEARRAFFLDIVGDSRYLLRCMLEDSIAPKRAQAWLKFSFPIIKQMMCFDMKINERDAAVGRERSVEALDWIAETVQKNGTGYLVGDRFTAADLSVAALFFPVTFPKEAGSQLPQPLSEGARTWLDRWQDHQAVTYIQEMFAKHRRGSESQPGRRD